MVTMKNRIGIYAFYDENGIVDDYVFHFLFLLKKITTRIVFVSNGPIKKEYINMLNRITGEILIRENTGFDVYAYKYAINHIEFNKLEKYDEVILCNSTFFGPINGLENIFLEMDKKEDLDFWGLTQSPDYFVDTDEIPAFYINPYGYIPKHIQSYFVVYRNKFIKTKHLRDFWNNLPMINSYAEAVGLFETVFTKYFEDLNYKWDTYLHYENDEKNINYPLLYKPYEVIVGYKFPIIKRKSFFIDDSLSIKYKTKDSVRKLIQYLNDNSCYDVDLIYKNITRTNKINNF